MNNHKCSICSKGFDTEKEYADHRCSTGFSPTEVEHQDVLTGGKFSEQSAEAQKRGANKTK
jgi:hypothetical protein